MANPWEKYGGQGASQPPPDPTFDYKAPRAEADLRGQNLDNEGQSLANELARLRIQEDQRKRAEEDAAKIDAESARGTAITELVSTIRAAEEAKRLSRDGWFATGFGASTAKDWSGTNAANVKGLLDTIGGNVAFDRLQRMRDASKTGGALGSVSERELDLLRGTIASLDQSQSDDQFQAQMDRIIQVYGDTLRKLDPEEAKKLSSPEGSSGGPYAGGQPPNGGGPNGLPRAKGARDHGGAEINGVTGKGGIVAVPELRGIENDVMNMIAGGASTDDVVTFLEGRYKPYGIEMTPELIGMIGGTIRKHKADPRAPISSLGSGWEMFWHKAVPEEESSVLGRAADTTVGNFLMQGANAATGGLPAYLAGKQDVMNAAAQERPKSAFAGEVVGNTLGMIGANRALGAAGQFGQRAANLGGGVVTDVGYGTLRGGLEGGTDGALLGALGAGGGNALGRYTLAPGARALADTRVGQSALNLGRRGGNSLANSARGLMGREAVPFRPADIPAQVPWGQRTVGARLPEDAAAQLREADQLGLPLAIGDLSPELQSLTGSVVRKSQNARNMADEVLGARNFGQADRAREQISNHFGPIDNPLEISEALLARGRRNSAPLYDDFRSQPARTSPELEAMLQTPAGARALQNARNIAANEGRDPTALGFDLDDLGQVVLRRDPSPETLDLVKRGFDDVLEGYRNTTTGRLALDGQGRAIEGLRRRYVGEVDRLYPNYADARRAYAGPASEREALDVGRSMSNAHPRDIDVRMRGMSDGQQDQFRLGQRVAMADTVGRRGLNGNPYPSIFGSPMARERASLVFGEGPAQGFQRAYDIENQMARTSHEALGGSPTAGRLAADEAFDNNIAAGAEALGAVATGGGGFGNLAGPLLRGLRDNYRVGASRQRADDLAPMLLNTNSAEAAQWVEDLLARTARRNNYVQRTRERGGLFGASLGTATLAPLVQ